MSARVYAHNVGALWVPSIAFVPVSIVRVNTPATRNRQNVQGSGHEWGQELVEGEQPGLFVVRQATAQRHGQAHGLELHGLARLAVRRWG